MLFRLVSDLHLEVEGGENYRLPSLKADADTVLLLAGDIGSVRDPDNNLYNFMNDVQGRFKNVLWTMGNHEHWRNPFQTTRMKGMDLIKEWDNVHLLQNQIFKIDNVVIIGSTLWTDYCKRDPLVMLTVEGAINDYKRIKYIHKKPGKANIYRKVRAIDLLRHHHEDRKFIFEQITKAKNEGKKVLVMTHHGPTWLSIHPRFIADGCNGAYVSDLSEQILDTEPEIWVHGHIHQPNTYMCGNTKIIINPKGYPREHTPLFHPSMTFEL